jgi:hypothetical protein
MDEKAELHEEEDKDEERGKRCGPTLSFVSSWMLSWKSGRVILASRNSSTQRRHGTDLVGIVIVRAVSTPLSSNVSDDSPTV